MLDLLFNLLDFNQAVNDIVGGMFVTNAMNYHTYPNTFLFSVVDEKGDLSCCALGFHEYILTPPCSPRPDGSTLLPVGSPQESSAAEPSRMKHGRR